MTRAVVDPPWDFAAWRAQARIALRMEIAPDALDWDDQRSPSLLGATTLDALASSNGCGASSGSPDASPVPTVPQAFLPLAANVLCHRDPQRHALLYRILWRLTHGEPHLLRRITDVDIHRAAGLDKAVRRDAHKMKAFVRFRGVPGEDNAYVAWFEPEHHIVDKVSGFFMRRFAGMRWAILTPYRSVFWDLDALSFGEGAVRSDAPADDAAESLWRTYYAHIFNPARLKPEAMRAEMPQKYWKNLPEATLVPTLMRQAGLRVREMAERAPEPPRRRIPAPVPAAIEPIEGGIEALQAAARDCRRCPLWQPATQTVFGEGPPDARVVVVGEQPGDEEDLSGRPFVGPAGRLFDKALAQVGLDRSRLYVTNAVKHFKFERRGKFRLHRNPEAAERAACRPWLERELAAIRPDVIVCMGATAAEAVLGKGVRLMQSRGRWHALADGTRVLPTVHPAYVLRQRGDAEREAAYRLMVEDLAMLQGATGPQPG